MAFIWLTKNMVALVDGPDAEWLSQYKWCAKTSQGRTYAVRREGKRQVYMHREVAKTPEGYFTDHINRDSLDNRKSNLRTCVRWQNQANRAIAANNTSGYKGVCWVKSRNKWVATIKASGKEKWLGYFDDVHKAGAARREAELKYHGEFAVR